MRTNLMEDRKMRRFISLLMCTIIFVLSANVSAWEFNTDDDTKGWTPNAKIADLKAGDGVLVATIKSNMTDPFISCSQEGPWDASDITGVLARMRWSLTPKRLPRKTPISRALPMRVN